MADFRLLFIVKPDGFFLIVFQFTVAEMKAALKLLIGGLRTVFQCSAQQRQRVFLPLVVFGFAPSLCVELHFVVYFIRHAVENRYRSFGGEGVLNMIAVKRDKPVAEIPVFEKLADNAVVKVRRSVTVGVKKMFIYEIGFY